MFCPRCGKQNQDNSLFCTWCGAGFTGVTAQKLDQPEPEKPAEQVEPPEPQVAEAIQPAETAAALKTGPDSPESEAVPVPGNIPQAGSSAPVTAERRAVFGGEVPMAQKSAVREQKYYTGAHIAICLAVAGVMAAAAGIFAGLYFSVIL